MAAGMKGQELMFTDKTDKYDDRPRAGTGPSTAPNKKPAEETGRRVLVIEFDYGHEPERRSAEPWLQITQFVRAPKSYDFSQKIMRLSKAEQTQLREALNTGMDGVVGYV
jgi:hypothetical protein